jgi:hypothetical protein
MDDPEDATSLRYWNGSAWTDDRSPKPPPPQVAGGSRHRPDSMWGGEPAPAPVAVALDGWVDVKLSTVPDVVINTTKGNWYKVHVSASAGDLSIASAKGVDVAHYARGTYTADMEMGFREVKKTPTWAMVLGVIGLLFFLIGIVFFFVKETRQEQTRVLRVTLEDGRTFSGPYVDAASYRR